MMHVVGAELAHQLRQLPFILHIEGLQHEQFSLSRLSGNNPVDVGVIIHPDADGRIRIHVPVGTAVQCRRVGVPAQRVEIFKVARVILVALTHRRVEAVLGDAYALAQDRCPECQRRQVALHLLDVVLAQQLQILDRGVFLIIDGHAAHAVQVTVQQPQPSLQVARNGFACSMHLADPLLRVPDFPKRALDGLYQFQVHFLAVVEEPRAFLRLGHVAQDHHSVVEAVLAKVALDAAVGRKHFILQLVVVNEFRLIHQHPRERQRVRRSRSVLAQDYDHASVVEADDMLIVFRVDDWRGKGLRRSFAHDIMDPLDESPPLPCRQQSRNGVCQTVPEGRHHDAARAARHALHVPQPKRSSD